ncbi:MAG: hypothetical protein Q8L14_03670, partial [Myxococcales bacterium]|nr:hypothetical protein [Myxococcales bacterium]
QLAKSIQESAMSQPVLKPVKGRAKAGPKKQKATSVEDQKLLELAIRVDQVAAGAEAHRPKRTWGGPLLIGLGVLLVLGIANRVVFKEKRVSSSGLVMWDGEPEEGTEGGGAKEPTKATGMSAIPGAIPGADSRPPFDEEPSGGADSEPIALPPTKTTPDPKSGEPRVRPKNPPAATGSGDIFLVLLPDGATVFKGKEKLGEGPVVPFSLPSGTHMLTIVGPDGIKRRLSVQASSAKKLSLKLNVPELPTQ